MRKLLTVFAAAMLAIGFEARAESDAAFRFVPEDEAATRPLRVVVTPGQVLFDESCLRAIDQPQQYGKDIGNGDVLEIHASEATADGSIHEWHAYFSVSCDANSVALDLDDLKDGVTYSATALLVDEDGHELWTTPPVRAEMPTAPTKQSIAH